MLLIKWIECHFHTAAESRNHQSCISVLNTLVFTYSSVIYRSNNTFNTSTRMHTFSGLTTAFLENLYMAQILIENKYITHFIFSNFRVWYFVRCKEYFSLQ